MGAGLDIDNTVYIDSPFTFNVFDLTPTVTFLALPRYRISPIIRGGLGGTFVSHNLGAYGRWVTKGGAIARVAKRLVFSALAGVEGNLPDSRFRQNFRCMLTDRPCSLGLVVDLGVGLAF